MMQVVSLLEAIVHVQYRTIVLTLLSLYQLHIYSLLHNIQISILKVLQFCDINTKFQIQLSS